MSVEVRLPTLLRKHAGDRSTLQTSGNTVGEVFENIAAEYPSLAAQLTNEEGGLHKFMNVYVNDDDVRFLGKLDAKVKDGDSITILPAVAGGAA